jgi:hypothetical protein
VAGVVAAADAVEAAFWVASEDSGSDDESPEEDSSPMAARIASSQACAASTVGVACAAVALAEPGTAAVAEPGTVACVEAACVAVGCSRDETLVTPPMGLTDMGLRGSREVPLT